MIMARPLRIGTAAPDFTAATSTGDSVTLSQFRGRKHVVLSFYPKDFTPGCTKQLCLYRDSHETLHALGAVILAVSRDGASRHQDFERQYRFPFHLLVDADGSLSRLYRADRLGGLFPMNRRITYVIDTGGTIRAVSHHEFAVHRHLDDALEVLERLAGNS
jgi:peroxiredoxin Q/BCP